MKSSRGYIALLSVLIVSALLLVLVVDASIDAILAREAATDEVSYRQSLYDAWSCGYLALNRLSFDPERFIYESTTTVALSSDERCLIIAASTTDTQAGVYVQGHSGNSFTPIYVQAKRDSSSTPYRVYSWEEL